MTDAFWNTMDTGYVANVATVVKVVADNADDGVTAGDQPMMPAGDDCTDEGETCECTTHVTNRVHCGSTGSMYFARISEATCSSWKRSENTHR